jgi:hypothetical protein
MRCGCCTVQHTINDIVAGLNPVAIHFCGIQVIDRDSKTRAGYSFVH